MAEKTTGTNSGVATTLAVVNAKMEQISPYFDHAKTRLQQVTKEYLRAIYESLDTLQLEQGRVQQAISKLQNELQGQQQVVADIQAQSTDPQLWPRQRQALQDRIDALTRQITSQQAEESRLQTQRDTARNTLQGAQNKQNILRASLHRQEEAVRQETDLTKITAMLTAQADKAADMNRQIAALEDQRIIAQSTVDNLTAQLTKANNDLSAEINQRGQLVEQAKQLSAKINAARPIQEQLHHAQEKAAKIQDQIDQWQADQTKLTAAGTRLQQQIKNVEQQLTTGLLTTAEMARAVVMQQPVRVSQSSAPVASEIQRPPASATGPVPQADVHVPAINLPTQRPYLFVLPQLPTKLEPVLLKYLAALFRFLSQHGLTVRVLVMDFSPQFTEDLRHFVAEIGDIPNLQFASFFATLQNVGQAKPFTMKELPVSVPLKKAKDGADMVSGKDKQVGDYRALYRPDGSLNWIGYAVDDTHYLYDYYAPQHTLWYTQIIVHRRDVSEVTYYRQDRSPVLKVTHNQSTAPVTTFFNGKTQEWPSLAAFQADWLAHDQIARTSTVVAMGDDPLCASVVQGPLQENVIPLLGDRTLTDPQLAEKVSGVHWLLAPDTSDIATLQQLVGWSIPVVTMDMLTSADDLTKEHED